MITGPSGSGKTTLLNLAALLDRPSSGRLLLEGQDLSAMPEGGLCRLRKTRIGMVFQKFCLLPHRSALANVRFRFRYLESEPAAAEARAREVLAQMGLAGMADRPARLLSAGEMQRVAVARAVVLRPALLLADEPTGNLDASMARVVMECFRELNRQGLTILMVTHNTALLPYGTRRLMCRDGTLVS
jgi:putative ABC transport system ATP-binding protein